MTDGRRVVELALRELGELDRRFSSEFRPYKSFRYANAGGAIHWGIATQKSTVTNVHDDTGTPQTRIAAQLTIDRGEESGGILASLMNERQSVEQALGHRLSWLDGGDNGKRQRALVRSWRALEGDEGTLAAWLAAEMLQLRAALQPHVLKLGHQVP
ncbi:MAG: hypothetical protein AB7I38_00135 [Dehalococcoidia bacterium]